MHAFKLISLGADPNLITSFDGMHGLTIDLGDFAFKLANSDILNKNSTTEIMAFTMANIFLVQHDIKHRYLEEITKILATQRCGRLAAEVSNEVRESKENVRMHNEYTLLERLAAILVRQFFVRDGQQDNLSWEALCSEMHNLKQQMYHVKYIFEPEVVTYWGGLCYSKNKLALQY